VESKTAFREAERARLLNGSSEGNSLAWLLRRAGYSMQGGKALQRAMWSDRQLYLSNNLTYKMDIALAGNAVEGRAPFLDHRLLQWTQFLPSAELVRGRENKILLRAAYERDLPPDILRRPKQGFGAPVAQWLAGPLREWAREVFPCPLLAPEQQRNLTGQRLWTMVALGAWAREWRVSW
jgi:asparagine synthase (glutamine-hydrolysing)